MPKSKVVSLARSLSVLRPNELNNFGEALLLQIQKAISNHAEKLNESPKLLFLPPHSALNLREFLSSLGTYPMAHTPPSRVVTIYGLEVVSTLALNEGELKVYAAQDLEEALKHTVLYGQTMILSRMHTGVIALNSDNREEPPEYPKVKFTRIEVDLRLLEDYRTYLQIKNNFQVKPCTS